LYLFVSRCFARSDGGVNQHEQIRSDPVVADIAQANGGLATAASVAG
jgi:hypothetical protein